MTGCAGWSSARTAIWTNPAGSERGDDGMSWSPWNSVRVRLTLWNGAVLAVLLAASAVVLCYRVQADLARSIDDELARDARDFAGRVSHLDPHIQSLAGDRSKGGKAPLGSWLL